MNYDPDKVYFTSDTHFFHTNIINYETRYKTYLWGNTTNFSSVEEMNEDIIERWNTVISNDDIVFHLGDFAWGNNNQWKELVDRLNGKIHLIKGNHDYVKSDSFLQSTFESVSDIKEIRLLFLDEEIPFILCHYPLYAWPKKHYGAIHLFGHVHSRFESIPGQANNKNVGWDIWNNPVSANKLATHFYKSNEV